MSTPILPLDVWKEGTLQNDIPANDNALRVEALSRPCLGVANNAAGGDAEGDVWIVGDTPTGAFASFSENDIAIRKMDTWYAWAPVEGLRLVVNDVRKVFDGSGGWIDDPSIGGCAVDSVNGQTGAVVLELGDLDDVDAASPTDGDVLTWDNGAGEWVPSAPAVGGDVTGPGSSTADAVALFDGTTGKLLKDGVKTIAQLREIEQNSKSSAYTLVLADAGKHILHPSADTTGRTFTIPANSSVAFPVGTAITFVNQNGAGVVTIAITSDTMRLAGAGTTGSRTLAANGIATALKIASTEWIINGTGLT